MGEGYALESPAAPQQVQADHGVLVYGRRPHYADDLVGGIGFQAGRSEPAVRHVHNLGDGRLFIDGANAPAADPFTVVSAPSRPRFLARLLGRFRRC